jgi:GMP synthase (glutamine-hydrolysing)
MKRPVIVIDWGSQSSPLARSIRELRIWSEVLPWNVSIEEIEGRRPLALVLSAQGAVAPPPFFSGLLDRGWPVLALGYGKQLLAKLTGFESPLQALVHGKPQLPPELEACVRVRPADTSSNKKIYGLEFHPEENETKVLLPNFLQGICGIQPNWLPEEYIEDTVAAIKNQIGGEKVICGLSGGVDSAVAAALVHKAVGDQLTCFFVDHGLLRKGEGEEVMAAFSGKGIKVMQIDARQRFLQRLKGITDPEAKRKAIGTQFIREFEAAARELGMAKFLVQGTVYPDVIESGSGDAVAVKSHHNVGGLPKNMEFELCEPVRALFKDEVREVGIRLGLPEAVVWRQPFPGPGLAIRVLGEVTEERLEIVREADAILREEIAAAGLNREVWQYFAALPGVRSVGISAGQRTYQELVAIRAVTSIDGMTADWARLPWEVLERISRRIVREVDQVNRVVYDITCKPPGTIEWE